MNDTGFAIIISNITIHDNDLPFALDYRTSINKAGHFESSQFNETLKRAGYFNSFLVPFGSTRIDVEDRTEWHPPKESVIYIIDYKEYNGHLFDLQLAGTLMSPKFRSGMDCLYRDDATRDSISMGGLLSYHQLELMKSGNRLSPHVLGSDELRDLKYLLATVRALGAEDPARRILQMYLDTDMLRPDSGLLTLSYFSILEAILTNGRTDGESITKQLFYKIRLLLRRSNKKPNYDFGSIEESKLWGKLYSLRSDIAHGNKYEFASKYQPLGCIEKANNYLDQIVALVIRVLLAERNFVDDLKEC